MPHMSRELKTSVANWLPVKYRVRIEIHFFCAQSLALETNHSHSRGSMNMKWRLR